MRPVFIMSLICGGMSLLAALGFSGMTILPRPGAESIRALMMIVASVFAAGWLGVATWARPRRTPAQPLPPQWLRRLLVVVSVVYLLGVLLFVIG